MEVLRKYGVATTILFPLVDAGAIDFESTPVSFVAADTQISKNEAAFANTGSTPAHEGNGMYSLALTATEMQAARIVITVIDQTSPKLWEDQAIIIDTYGNASAEHAFDLDDDGDKIADAVLRRPTASVESGWTEDDRTLYGVVAALMHKHKRDGSIITLYKSDDSTVLATIPITTQTGLAPISEIDPS